MRHWRTRNCGIGRRFFPLTCTTSAGAGAFLLGHTEGGTAVSTKFQSDFDQSLESISSFGRGSTPSSHVVRAGESLSSIAASLWGDSSLWYKLAEANGLSGAAMLGEGQTLRIPAGVMSSAHNASSFTPYDPSEAVANISPSAPKPPKKKGCGGFGQILLVVIAVVVTIYTAGAASALFAGQGLAAAGTAGLTALGGGGLAAGAGLAGGIAAGAIGGAVGSIVSQGVGVMTGIQEKFSWNAVALAAIGGGVGASGFGNAVAKSVGAANGLANAAVSSAANNALTQGIGVALGAQKEFSWAGVAAAGVGGAAFQLAGKLLPGAARFDVVKGQKVPIAASWSNKLGATMASTIADAGARSLIEGSDFGDNVMAALPNVIGQTIGNAVAGGMLGRSSSASASAKVGSIPKNAKEVCQEVGVDLSQGLTREGVLNYFGVEPGYEGELEFLPLGQVELAEEIVVTATRRGRIGANDGWWRGIDFTPDQPPSVGPSEHYAPRQSQWLQTIGALTNQPQSFPTYEQVLSRENSGGYSWTAGPTEFELWEQQQRVKGVARVVTMTGTTIGTAMWVTSGGDDRALAVGAAWEGVAGGMFGRPALSPHSRPYVAPAGAKAPLDRETLPLLNRIGVEHSAMARTRYYSRLEGSRSWGSWDAFRAEMGSAGAGLNWHHIVEQHSGNIARFGPRAIHNTENIVVIDATAHGQISAYYASKRDFTRGLTVRDWLRTQSYEEQRAFGESTLRRFGSEQ